MKTKLFLLLLLCVVATYARAQITEQPQKFNAFGYQYKRVLVDSSLTLPDTSNLHASLKNRPNLAAKDSVLYLWDVTKQKFIPIAKVGTSGGGNVLWSDILGNISTNTQLRDSFLKKQDDLPFNGNVAMFLSGANTFVSFYNTLRNAADTAYAPYWWVRQQITSLQNGNADSLLFFNGLRRLGNNVSALYGEPIWNASRLQSYYVDQTPPRDNSFLGFDSADGVWRSMSPDSAVAADLQNYVIRQEMQDSLDNVNQRIDSVISSGGTGGRTYYAGYGLTMPNDSTMAVDTADVAYKDWVSDQMQAMADTLPNSNHTHTEFYTKAEVDSIAANLGGNDDSAYVRTEALPDSTGFDFYRRDGSYTRVKFESGEGGSSADLTNYYTKSQTDSAITANAGIDTVGLHRVLMTSNGSWKNINLSNDAGGYLSLSANGSSLSETYGDLALTLRVNRELPDYGQIAFSSAANTGDAYIDISGGGLGNWRYGNGYVWDNQGMSRYRFPSKSNSTDTLATLADVRSAGGSGGSVTASSTTTFTNKRTIPHTVYYATGVGTGGNIDNHDMAVTLALDGNTTVQVPNGTPNDGETMLLRIKDNGTSRTLGWPVAYRFSPDLPAPTATTANKTMYIGIIYNSADAKWDVVSILNGF